MEPEVSKQNKINIDFNYPPLNRKDLMSLSTIGPQDVKMKQFKKMDTTRDWSVNLYNLDIEKVKQNVINVVKKYGSSSLYLNFTVAFNQKIDFINKNDDIERSTSKLLHVGLNKPEYNLSNKDIEFSSPGCVKIKTTRHLNPLEPKYNLPICEPLPFSTPKFIRDGIQIADIEGARPKKIMTKWSTRESLKKDDIKDASPRVPYVRSTKYSNMDYRDVTQADFKSRRRTNPLEPVYRLGYVTGEKIQIGPIDGNKPVVFSKYKYPEPYNLRVNDIYGTNSGSKNFINKFNGQNYGYTSLDIPGAQTGTLKKGIITDRCLNPLVPRYQYIGGKELVGLERPVNTFQRNSNTTIPGKKMDRKIQKVSIINDNSKEMLHSNSEIVSPVTNDMPAFANTINTSNAVQPNVVKAEPPVVDIAPTVPNKEANANANSHVNSHSLSPARSPRASHSLSPAHSPKGSPKPTYEIRKDAQSPKTVKNNQPKNANPTDLQLDLADMPYVEDIVKFDKSKYNKPKPFYGFLHDKYIIPPIEEHKKGEIKSDINLSQAEREKRQVNTSYQPQRTSFNSSISF